MNKVIAGTFVFVLLACWTVATAARIRPGRDPADERVIWADPFDNYSQWAYDNEEFWEGGPVPAGDPGGSYPRKSDDGTGCGVSKQVTPGLHQMAREQWPAFMECPVITSPVGRPADPGAFEANYDSNCGVSGEVVTTRGMRATANYTWGMGGSYNSMTQFSHRFLDRIQAINPAMNAVNGTDDHPLVVVFYLHDKGGVGNQRALFDNSYVELSLGDERAPTDYIWRGDPNVAYPGPECCPQGPYPIVCQQVREVNGSVSENAADLQYLNEHCPPLVPPYDPQTQTGKTWASIAFGFGAILDKDPCGCEEQGVDAHKPTMGHFVVFDGNKWRELRNSRYGGLKDLSTGQDLPQAGGVDVTWPPAPGVLSENIGLGTSNLCNNFSLSEGDNHVILKIISDYILIYVDNSFYNASKTNPPWHAAIPRLYKGPFDTISLGVGPGCELDPLTGECKEGGTPTQCLTYSQSSPVGYMRTDMDSASVFDGELEYVPNVYTGACCHPNGTCTIEDEVYCINELGGWFGGPGTTCDDILCCGTPFADADGDGDVDQGDFGVFEACLTGPGGGATGDCRCFDRRDENNQHGQDGDVDQDDYGAFENCASGPGIPANPACDDPPPG